MKQRGEENKTQNNSSLNLERISMVAFSNGVGSQISLSLPFTEGLLPSGYVF